MDLDSERYKGPATTRYSYMNEFLVECPQCKEQATVRIDKEERNGRKHLVCSACHHTESQNRLIRYEAIVKRNCDNCGHPIRISTLNNKEPVKELNLSCPECRIVRTYEPKNESYHLVYKSQGAAVCDPVFNLPLWFQADIKGQTFWAYNREHLTEIRNYVSSKLRERQTLEHSTMVERLPVVITNSKNRDTVLKTIDRLLRK